MMLGRVAFSAADGVSNFFSTMPLASSPSLSPHQFLLPPLPSSLPFFSSGAKYVQGALNWGTASGTRTRRGPTVARRSAAGSTRTLERTWTSGPVAVRFTRLIPYAFSSRMSVDTRLNTLLDVPFSEPFFQFGDFPPTTTGPDGRPTAVQDPWRNGTNATPFDQDFSLIMKAAVGGTNGWFPDR
ncbi:hypothetical protein B0H11DRAFT_1975351 [Mycena galericulata]|nr:hypothetical protein B0H11DRAFT_1975351 [Mycena galericulata]